MVKQDHSEGYVSATTTIKKVKIEANTFVTPVIVGVSCGTALLVSAAMFYSPLQLGWLLPLIVSVSIFASALVVFGSAVIVIIALPMLIFKSKRQLAIDLLISCLCLALAPIIAWILLPTTEYFKKGQIEQIEKNADPLIQAIEKYSSENRHPPENLKILVPQYIADLPATGYSLNPNYDYMVVKHTNEISWELSLDYGMRIVSSQDRLVYKPSENYAQNNGATFERIGKWALVHEHWY